MRRFWSSLKVLVGTYASVATGGLLVAAMGTYVTMYDQPVPKPWSVLLYVAFVVITFIATFRKLTSQLEVYRVLPIIDLRAEATWYDERGLQGTFHRIIATNRAAHVEAQDCRILVDAAEPLPQYFFGGPLQVTDADPGRFAANVAAGAPCRFDLLFSSKRVQGRSPPVETTLARTTRPDLTRETGTVTLTLLVAGTNLQNGAERWKCVLAFRDFEPSVVSLQRGET
jgi:hypothetical protein